MGYFTGNFKRESFQDNEIFEKLNTLYKGLEICRTIESAHYNELHKIQKENLIIAERLISDLEKKLNICINYINLPWYKKIFTSFEKFKIKQYEKGNN